MINNNAILKFKTILTCFFLLFLCSFRSLAGDLNIEDLPYYDGIMTLEGNDSLYINEVKTDSEYKYFLIYKGTDNNFYFSRVKETTGWTVYSNGRMQIQTMHKTTKFTNKEAMFQAVKTDITTEAASGRLDVYKENVYVCNFDIGTMVAHSWVDGKESTDKGEIIKPDPDTGENDNTGIIQNIANKINSIIEGIKEIPSIVLEGIKSLFIPSEAFMSEYKEKLMKKFEFVNDIQNVFKKVISLIQKNDTPPKFVVDLGQKLGGKVTIMDFSQFDISLMRDLLGAFLLIKYIVSLFRKTPETIQASGGTNSDN